MKSFQQFNEVAPPGWGHTKAEKEKTDPSKPKSKIGGTIAAMKRAQDRGDIPKKLNIFALAYSMKNKGANPHYIPGTKEKYKKYQEEDKKDVRLKKEGQSSFSDKSNTFTQEETSMPNVSKKDRGAIKKRYKNLFTRDISGNKQGVNEGKCDDCTCIGCGPDGVGHQNPCVECGGHHKEENVNETISGRDAKKLAKASVLSQSPDPKKQNRARATQVEIDYQDLMRQRKEKKVSVGKSMREEKKLSPMQDNNLFGNAYAQRQKKKAIDTIPHKGSEEYRRNLQHKSPTDPRESVEVLHGADGKVAHEIVDIIKPEPMRVPESPVKWKELTELRKLPNYNKTGNIIDVYLAWRGRTYSIQMFFPQIKKPSRKDVIDQLEKVYPGSKIHSYQIGTYNPGEPVLQIN